MGANRVYRVLRSKLLQSAVIALGLGTVFALPDFFLHHERVEAASTYYPPGYITPATATCTPANQTAPASTSAFAMQGFGCLITPVTPSGKLLVLFKATANDSATTVGNGIIIKLYCGTGPAPANAAAIPANVVLTGTQVEWATGVTLTTAADAFQNMHAYEIAAGLTPGTQYWCDVAAESVITASNVALINVSMTLAEIG